MSDGAIRIPPLAAFAHRDFRLFAAARFLATLSIQMMSVAVGFQVYAQSHRALDLGLVGLVQFVPVAVLSIPAGQVADRFDRRRILFCCALVYGACISALYVLSVAPRPRLFAILAVLSVIGAARAYYGPAASSLLPSLVPREHFPNAVTWQSALWQGASITGPGLGGLIYGLAGAPGPVYLTAAAGFAVAAALLLAVRAPAAKSARPAATLREALAGLRFVARSRILLGAMSLDFFAVFLGGATALLPIYATDILSVGPRGLGLLRAAPSVGAALTAAILAFRPLGRRTGAKMLVCIAIFGAATIVFGLSTWFPLSIAALAILGAADMVSAVVRGTLIQSATPDDVRGRVSAVSFIFIGASNELGELESGTAAQWLGPVAATVLGGAGTLVVVALWAKLFPELRRVDRLEDVRPDEAGAADR